MSRRWLLSLSCLCVFLVLFVQLTHADGELRVNETRTRILLTKEPIEVLLAVENSSGRIVNAEIQIELLAPDNRIMAQRNLVQAVGTGNQTLRLSLPAAFSSLKPEHRRKLLWYRLHYRLHEQGSPAASVSEGILSLSEIAPELFEIRIATAETLREGGRYRARVQTIHPVTRRPAADVRIDGEITLEDDADNTPKLRASATTDSKGYALLEFVLPSRSPLFQHASSGGEIHVIGRKGAIFAEARGDVRVDQFARILISTDKPLYQPGQTMHVRALLFSPAKHALAGQDVLIRICDPEDTTIFRSIVKSSRFGIANTDWPVPETSRLGEYRIWVGVDGDDRSDDVAYDVRISRYDLPNFSVSVQPDRAYYLPGQNAAVRVHADYLFGKPVARGHVRVVRETEREWNYREQKWDITEGDVYEGETDAQGAFTAHIDLADTHSEIADEDYSRFRDVSYAAYFTDPTTNRTEQRRFALRATRQAIHVYVIKSYYDYDRSQPLKFYVSTFNADGSPARCKVNLKLTNTDNGTGRSLGTLRTNRYGLAKVSGIRLPREFKDTDRPELLVSAVDSKGRTGTRSEELSLDDGPTVLVETDKTLYKAGEPITALITSDAEDKAVIVDLARESGVLRSERVQLHDGHGLVTFSYKPEFRDKLTLVAYHDFPESERLIGRRTILYPNNSELKLNVRPSQASYRPGEDAQVSLNVRAPAGSTSESALGVVVLDKAVQERFRTDQEFGQNSFTSNGPLESFLGLDQQIAGVTLRDLQRLDMTTLISPDLDLLAEVLLNQTAEYFPSFYASEMYETEQAHVFGDAIKQQLEPARNALMAYYASKADYPKDESELRRILTESRIDPNTLRDPWGTTYRAVFSIEKVSDLLNLVSAGPDKRFDTPDDFSVARLYWPYFRTVGEAIDKAVRRYHERTGGFIRDFSTLNHEVAKDNVDLERLVDRWGKPYRLEFEVRQSNYVITISSGGPDKQFSLPTSYAVDDDFIIWASSIDYFAEQGTRIQSALNENLKTTKRFPQNEEELKEILRASEQPVESLRDPWGRAYYTTFKTESLYADRTRIENRARNGEQPTSRVELTPVTRQLGLVSLRSMGPDGAVGTMDDFDVASFSGVISEQPRETPERQVVSSPVVFSGNGGAISGVVSDEHDARIPGATITATLSPSGQNYKTSSNDEGTYTLTNLPPGIYEVRFEAVAFKSTVFTGVLVRAGNVIQVNATLELGAIAETVTVTSGGNPIQTQNSEVAASVVRSLARTVNVITKSETSQALSTPRLREYFPETLLWQPSIETDKQGRAKIKFKLADNITTWKMEIIGSTEDGHIGTAETEIKAFQPFFVEHDPPRVLTEGDEISLPVVVRNYLERPQNVDLEIKPERWFSLLESPRKRSSVAAGDAARETFNFRVVASVKDGKQRITATGAEDNDAIEKPVTVHPDGEEMSQTAGDILGDSAVLELNVPEAMIPNSKQAKLKIYPNLMAHVVESVEAIMARPYGCGEQTISSTYPSLLLLRHRKQSGEDSSLRARAERYVNDGYSRLLNYRAESGGFTYWGYGEPDVALTAYALQFLTDASDVIAVDKEVINSAHEWLIKQQQSDGRWRAHQYWSEHEDTRRSAVLTAYVARVLTRIDTKNIAPELKRAFSYLDQRAREIDEPYLLASYASALIDAKDSARAKPIIEKLRSMVHSEGNSFYWALETNTPFYGWGIAGRVETTALVVQALSKYCDSSTENCEADKKVIHGGLLFLLKQKDQYGVWYSTQATINVLDALRGFLVSNPASQGESAAEIVINDRLVQTIQIPAARGLVNPIVVDISQFVNAGKNTVKIGRSGGSAFASVHALVNYYVPWSLSNHVRTNESSDLRLLTNFDKTEAKINDTITCHVEAERVGFRGYGMMIAEIGLPPGADVDRSSLETAIKSSNWAINQYDVLPDRIVLYLWPWSGGVKFDFQFRPRFGMKAKTAPSVLYDYYNPEARIIQSPAIFRVQ